MTRARVLSFSKERGVKERRACRGRKVGERHQLIFFLAFQSIAFCWKLWTRGAKAAQGPSSSLSFSLSLSLERGEKMGAGHSSSNGGSSHREACRRRRRRGGRCGQETMAATAASTSSFAAPSSSSSARHQQQQQQQYLRTFTSDELFAMTAGFSRSRRIGEGGFGQVFAGDLLCSSSGGSGGVGGGVGAPPPLSSSPAHSPLAVVVPVAVKLLEPGSLQGEAEFEAEVRALRWRGPHPNVVRLLGVCVEGGGRGGEGIVFCL